MAISAYILKIVEKYPFLRLQMGAKELAIKVFFTCIKTAWNRVRNMLATVLTTITTIWRPGFIFVTALYHISQKEFIRTTLVTMYL